MYKLNNTQSLNDKGIDLFTFAIFSLFLTGILLSTVSFDAMGNLAFYLLFFGLCTSILLLESYMVRRREFSLYLAIPVIISATQNLYLGIVAPYAGSTQIQLMVVTNFLFSIILLFFIFLKTPFRFNQAFYQRMIIISIVLIGYSIATIVMFNADITSAIASLRNIITPMLFLLIGLLACINVNLKRFLKYISYITIFVVMFGILERFFLNGFWFSVNLPDLWEKKGLPLNAFTGLPVNFFSSEMVNGKQLRRMVSSFADPVNLGTFLFFGFMAAWYLKKRTLVLAVLACIALAVSKGALLGLLVFCVIWSYHKLPKYAFVLVLMGTGLAGLAFIFYSMSNSTMSVFLHFSGFFAAFPELVHHPLGRGLGNIGVLAGLYSSGAKTEITESGLGMVIGQLGIVGLVLFIYFFWCLWKKSRVVEDKKEKILVQSLILSILLNIMFNEVALSPNSSAVYFMTIGIVLGQWYAKNKDKNLSKIKLKFNLSDSKTPDV